MTNQQIIEAFYNAFQHKDYAKMGALYHEEATFSDEVFVGLNSYQTRKMWEMLCKTGKDFTIQYNSVQANDITGSAFWQADYTFSKTGNKVVNKINASFEFKDGLIIKHIDSFDFYRWSSQALGFSGRLLGWTDFLKNKVRKNARENLDLFIKKNP